MQLSSHWYVTNKTDKPINILNVYIKKPRIQGRIMLKDTHSSYYGSYPVLPNTITEASADFWVLPPFCKEGKNFKVDIVFIDQYGKKRTVKDVVFESDKRNAPVPVKLVEEEIYKLKHDIEKKVAAVLKDEINRYKKYGRRSGELGSILVTHNGKKIKKIYQDSWESSKSGERQEIVNDPENYSVGSENGDILVKLFNELQNDKDKELFINSLIFRLSRDKEYYCVSYLILYVLLRIRLLSKVLDTAKISLQTRKSFWQKLGFKKSTSPLEQHQQYGFSDFLGLINGMLRYEHTAFTVQELDKIEEFVTNLSEHTFKISEKLNSVRSYRLIN